MNYICSDINHNQRPDNPSPCFHLYKGCCNLPNHYRCIESIRRKNPTLSHSSKVTFDKCRRAFWWSWVQGIRYSGFNLPMTLGTLFHARAALIHADENIVPKFQTVDDKGNIIFTQPKIESQKEITAKCIEAINKHSQENEDVSASILLMKGLVKGYSETEWSEMKGDIEVYKKIETDRYSIVSITDLIVGDKIWDYKWTGKPEYHSLFTSYHQGGLYLLSHPHAKSITFRIIRTPQLRKGKNESDVEFIERMRQDFHARQKWYVTDKTYYRAEFNFNEIEDDLAAITDEVKSNIDKGISYFRQNRSACYLPYQCDYLKLCESGLSPENLPELYSKREVK